MDSGKTIVSVSYLRRHWRRDARRKRLDYDACEVMSESGHLVCSNRAAFWLALDSERLFVPEERLLACGEHVGHVEHFMRLNCGVPLTERTEWIPIPQTA